MRLPPAVFCLVTVISTNLAFAGEVKRIDYGQFRVEYQIPGKAKSLKEAKKACTDLGENGAWRLPEGREFWATLMTGNSLFTTIPATSGDGYLGWVAGSDVPPTPQDGTDDFVISVEDGRGTQTDFISISEVLKNFSDEKIAKVPADQRGRFQSIKRTLQEGVQVVCYKPIASN
jgi:hypothetical protein